MNFDEMNKILIHNNTSYTYEGAKKIADDAWEALQNSYKESKKFREKEIGSEFGKFLEDISDVSLWFVLIYTVIAFLLKRPLNFIPYILFFCTSVWLLIYQTIETKNYIKKLEFFGKQSEDLYQAWVLAYNNYCTRYYQNLLHEVIMETKNRTLTEKEFEDIEKLTRVK